MGMRHTAHTVPGPVGRADLDLLASARHRIRQLIARLETLPFTEDTARLASEYVAQAGPVREAFDRFTQLDAAERERQMRVWNGAAS
ncbi:hypothetical protein [Streptomyces sp. NPDC057694]|uniref:hypothetical protein n=1 Tax=Streptomyces sp. NPDC057694 TaxID=3346216 RepID=UPI003674D7CC